MTDPDATQSPGETQPVDRAAALAEGAPRVPRRMVVIAVIVAATLALGGTALEHLASSAGLNPTPTPTPTPGAGTPVTSPRPTSPPELRASTAAFLGAVHLPAGPAPPINLTDQNSQRVTLDQLAEKWSWSPSSTRIAPMPARCWPQTSSGPRPTSTPTVPVSSS